MGRRWLALVLVGALSGCSLFGSETAPTTTTTTMPASTSTSTSTTTSTTLAPSARLDDLPDIDRDSPASLIRVAQRLTTARGFPADVDGGFGRQTRARVNALREFAELEPIGVVDADLWRAMFDESTLPFGPVDAQVIDGVATVAGLQVPVISFLFNEQVIDGVTEQHHLIPFHVDAMMFADWARERATAELGEAWTVCAPMTGSGTDLVTLTGVSTDGQEFRYRVTTMGRGRVDLHVWLGSATFAQCP
jgi:hypothetical protein